MPSGSATPPPPLTAGSFDDRGNATVRVAVFGAVEQTKKEFEAIIDTGFTGFLSMPMVSAFPLALILFGTTSVMLADGSTQPRLTALGTVQIGNESQVGVIVLEPVGKDVLIGMDLLRKFRRALFVSASGVALISEDAVTFLLSEAQKAITQQPAPSTPMAPDPPPPSS